MSYFRLSCCSQGTLKIILLVLNILLMIIGGSHCGYASIYQTIKYKGDELGTITGVDNALIFGPTITYYLSGIYLIVISIISILVIFECIGKQNRLKWCRVILGLLIIELGISMAVATYNSLMFPFYTQNYTVVLNMSESTVDALTEPSRGLFFAIRSMHRYTMALAIINWIVAVPSVIIQILALVDQFINDVTIASNTVGATKVNEMTKTDFQ